MDIQRKCGITASDIDAMTSEELLELAKAQGQYVGRRPMPGWAWRQPQSWIKSSWPCGRST